ncbi:MAG: thymidine phosphorylase, partial [Actinobacteria bacterium]|nr:thymidine phosphorylase [Actinomycetota bacterium]
MSAPFLPQEIIRAKRDGRELTGSDIERFVAGLTDGSIGDDQVAAFAMAVYFRGMTVAERVALTAAMAHSGSVMHWDRTKLPGPVLDKHSTGGVGDKVSLMLAPLVAACGGVVPMISGRGLGHTGGTLDKLESIPGYTATPSQEQFRSAVLAAGCAVIGQTGDL